MYCIPDHALVPTRADHEPIVPKSTCGFYCRQFVSKLVMTTLCKQCVISRDKLLPSRDFYDTSRDNCDTSRVNCDISRDNCDTLRDNGDTSRAITALLHAKQFRINCTHRAITAFLHAKHRRIAAVTSRNNGVTSRRNSYIARCSPITYISSLRMRNARAP